MDSLLHDPAAPPASFLLFLPWLLFISGPWSLPFPLPANNLGQTFLWLPSPPCSHLHSVSPTASKRLFLLYLCCHKWLLAHAPPSLHGSPCAHLFVCLSTLCLHPLQCKPSAGRALSTFSLLLSQLLEECFRHLAGCRNGLHEKTRTWLLSPVTCLTVKIYSFKHLKDNNNNGAKRSGSPPTYILHSWVTQTGDPGFSPIIKETNFLNLLLYTFLLMGKA